MKNPPIATMHSMFGKRDGSICRDCTNLLGYSYFGKKYYKCDIYGVSHSTATDWKLKWQACGHFDKPKDGVLREVKDWRVTKKEAGSKPINGQIDIFEG